MSFLPPFLYRLSQQIQRRQKNENAPIGSETFCRMGGDKSFSGAAGHHDGRAQSVRWNTARGNVQSTYGGVHCFYLMRPQSASHSEFLSWSLTGVPDERSSYTAHQVMQPGGTLA
ncbi:hypothetical protein TPA0909_60390 [Streptomyces albus]|nr:hypothetical protein TPA0909_60390 [Streptomyces albus]